MTIWNRLESMGRSIDLDGGLEARVADPLWLLARQWQVSEFRGDDAAQPVAVRVTKRSMEVNAVAGLDGKDRPFPETMPLEALVEAAPAPNFGSAGLYASAKGSRRLMRMLNDAGLGPVVDALRAAFPLSSPDRSVAFGQSGTQAVSLLVRYGIDTDALASALPPTIAKAVSAVVAREDQVLAKTLIARWRDWYRGRDGGTGGVAWDGNRLEHRFTLSSRTRSAQNGAAVVLDAPAHHGGHLDWYAFDLLSSERKIVDRIATQAKTVFPGPARYRGMPASRWWEFEDGTVDFGGIEAGPTDLARLLVAEFATVYSGDWFVIPMPVPVGSLTEITRLQVLDSFGGRSRLQSVAANDAERVGEDARVWRLFELTGDEVTTDHPSPWLLAAPTLAGDLHGPVLERVLLARDEGANLAWAVERLVEGPLGRPVDRAQAWHAANLPPPTNEDEPQAEGSAVKPPRRYSDQIWRYQLETQAPPWWIPMLAERIAPGSAEVRLRRGRMQAWDLLRDGQAADQLGPQSTILDPRQPFWMYEEEIPRSGAKFERRWQFGRWHDGSFHVWIQRRKMAGRGERSSGLSWDLLLEDHTDAGSDEA